MSTAPCTPRSLMPQINYEDYQELFDYIGKRGITAKFRHVVPSLCRPSQCMDPFDPLRTSALYAAQRPILAAKDLHIIDGHHRWQAMCLAGFSVIPAFVMDRDLEGVLPTLQAFPKTYHCSEC